MRSVDADVVQASAEIATLGESPVWCPRHRLLYWVDVRAPALFALDPARGQTTRWPLPEIVGGVVLAQDGLVLALRSGLHRFDPASGASAPLLTLESPAADNRLNDVKCDAAGRLWVGTMRDFGAAATGTLYRVAHGVATAMVAPVTIPNGPCWSPDGATFYFADTPEASIRAYAFDAARGELGAMRTLVARGALPGRPDGATVDAEGFLWSARYGGGGIARIDPAGRVERFLRLPVTQVSSVMFGGTDLDVLYVTTSRQRMDRAALAREPLAGALLAVDPRVRGLPEFHFAG